jgi:hypothetical protein
VYPAWDVSIARDAEPSAGTLLANESLPATAVDGASVPETGVMTIRTAKLTGPVRLPVSNTSTHRVAGCAVAVRCVVRAGETVASLA